MARVLLIASYGEHKVGDIVEGVEAERLLADAHGAVVRLPAPSVEPAAAPLPPPPSPPAPVTPPAPTEESKPNTNEDQQ